VVWRLRRLLLGAPKNLLRANIKNARDQKRKA
jgi:hypothetical protein